MKKDAVNIGGTYVAAVSGKPTTVRIVAESPYGGWDAVNTATGRAVRIKSARRLRGEAETPADQPAAAEAASNEPEPGAGVAPPVDPDRCVSKGCRHPPTMTYLKKPMCDYHWKESCRTESPIVEEGGYRIREPSVDAEQPSEPRVTPDEETDDMAKRKSKRSSPERKAKAAAKGSARASKPAAAAEKNGKLSALDAAAKVLKSSGKPMRAQELITAMAEKGLWTSPGGKTPHATLYAAMQREEAQKGKESRFKRVERGLFEFVG